MKISEVLQNNVHKNLRVNDTNDESTSKGTI